MQHIYEKRNLSYLASQPIPNDLGNVSPRMKRKGRAQLIAGYSVCIENWKNIMSTSLHHRPEPIIGIRIPDVLPGGAQGTRDCDCWNYKAPRGSNA